MVEATPATWRDVCERCGSGFAEGESRWIEQRCDLVHTQCADWSKWAEPPYSWKLRKLRKQYRLQELTGDYAAPFLRYPNVEGRPSVEAYEKMRVLAAIRVHPWRKKLAAQALTLERESLKAAGIQLRQKEDWWERSWIESIPGTVKRCEWDVQAVARDLITTLPASLRLKRTGYPDLIADSVQAAAAAVASKIRNEVKDSKRCKDPHAITIGRLALQALGYEGARSLCLFRPQKDTD